MGGLRIFTVNRAKEIINHTFSITLKETSGGGDAGRQGNLCFKPQVIAHEMLSLVVGGSWDVFAHSERIYLIITRMLGPTELGTKWLFKGLRYPKIIWLCTCNI